MLRALAFASFWIFLLANLITGAANAAMHADGAPATLALATLAAYMTVLGVAARYVLEVARAAPRRTLNLLLLRSLLAPDRRRGLWRYCQYLWARFWLA